MDKIKFILNGEIIETGQHAGVSVLDFLRKRMNLVGTKEGCREGECGACSVLIGEHDGKNTGYRVFTSCLLTLGHVMGKHLVTIEGLNRDKLNPVQKLLVDNFGIQCGYCTPGLVVALTGFMMNSGNLSVLDAIDSLDGNICRCTGYVGIRKALKKLSGTYGKKLKDTDRISQLVEWKILPGYFAEIPDSLSKINKTIKTGRLTGGKNTILVGGATDLMVQNPDLMKNSSLTYLSDYPYLKEITLTKTFINVGAGISMYDFQNNGIIRKHFPEIDKYFSLIASSILRSKATLAGNIVNASPTADLTVILLAMKARLVITDGKSRREVMLRNFYKGHKNIDLRKAEFIEHIRIPILPRKYLFHFEKVAYRKYLDIAIINTAIGISMDKGRFADVAVSAGGVESYPKILENVSTFLIGKTPTKENISTALKCLVDDINPRSGKHGSKEYKTLLIRNLLIAHFIKLFPDKIFFEDFT